jgi:hypothetical protein
LGGIGEGQAVKIIAVKDMLGRNVAFFREAVRLTDQAFFLDNTLTPEMKKERRLAEQHRKSGGKELF